MKNKIIAIIFFVLAISAFIFMCFSFAYMTNHFFNVSWQTQGVFWVLFLGSIFIIPACIVWGCEFWSHKEVLKEYE